MLDEKAAEKEIEAILAITALALRMSAEAVFGGGAGAPVERWDAARPGLRAGPANRRRPPRAR